MKLELLLLLLVVSWTPVFNLKNAYQAIFVWSDFAFALSNEANQ